MFFVMVVFVVLRLFVCIVVLVWWRVFVSVLWEGVGGVVME